MSEFKYACPVCGQHIRCDSSQSGSTMECPTCFQKIIAPQAPATDDPKFILTGTKAGERPVSPVAMKPAGMAPDKKISGATVVLMIFILIAAAVGFVYHGTIFKNPLLETASPTNQTAALPAPVRSVIVPAPSNDPNWTLNLIAVTISDAPATGRIHGQSFISERAILEGGILSLRMPDHGPADLGISIYLHAKQSQDLAEQSVNITNDFTNAPRVTLRWKNDGQQTMTETFKTGYVLRIEFGGLAGNHLPGKIYLGAPDDTKSYVMGTFNAEIRKPKSSP